MCSGRRLSRQRAYGFPNKVWQAIVGADKA
jgi:hypothetical protein